MTQIYQPASHTVGLPPSGVPLEQEQEQEKDSRVLRYMQVRLFGYLNDPTGQAERFQPHTTYLREPGGRQHRLVLLNPAPLRAGAARTFVGFFGHKRPGADSEALDALDLELIHELRDYPHILSYSSLELASGDWANLVVLTNPEGIAAWAASARHGYAAREVAPQCYTSIRLHIGTLTLGTDLRGQLEINRTKHFVFES